MTAVEGIEEYWFTAIVMVPVAVALVVVSAKELSAADSRSDVQFVHLATFVAKAAVEVMTPANVLEGSPKKIPASTIAGLKIDRRRPGMGEIDLTPRGAGRVLIIERFIYLSMRQEDGFCNGKSFEMGAILILVAQEINPIARAVKFYRIK